LRGIADIADGAGGNVWAQAAVASPLASPLASIPMKIARIT
jgi:hypothetical protein